MDNDDNSTGISHECRQCHEIQPITEFINPKNPTVPTVECQRCRSRKRELYRQSSRFVPGLPTLAKLIYSSRAVQTLRRSQQSLKDSRKRSNTEAGLSPSHHFRSGPG